MNIENLVTCKGNGIFAIIGRDEIESYPSYDEPYNYIKEFPNDICFLTQDEINDAVEKGIKKVFEKIKIEDKLIIKIEEIQ